MKTVLLIAMFISSLLSAKYLTNESCKECHEEIYYEYQSSHHSKTYFNNELHRKVANKVSRSSYDCGTCHMPGATNLKELESGKHQPSLHEIEQTDAISCFFCHQIGFVKQAHDKNINYLSKKPAGFKPSMFGSLKNADDSDKHEMLNNPIYKKNVCLGCHSHKRNSHGVLIFSAMEDNQDSTECVNCHMPYVRGGVEKINKKGRTEHRSHDFPGIHNMEMVKEGVKLSVTTKGNVVEVLVENRMPHPLIIQASRLKYLELTLTRDSKLIWKNFKESPMEDKQGAFVTEFLGENGEFVSIPAFAYSRGFVNNLKAKESRVLKYELPKIISGDVIKASMFVVLVKPSCSGELDLKDKRLTQPTLMESFTYKKP